MSLNLPPWCAADTPTRMRAKDVRKFLRKQRRAERKLKKQKEKANNLAKERETPPDRDWFTSRMRKLGFKQNSLAAQIGVRHESLGRMLTGEREVSAAEAVALATALRVPVAAVMHRLGLGDAAGLTVSGRILNDGRVSSIVDESAARSCVPASYPPEAVALVVEAAQGPLATWDGAVVVYMPSAERSVGPSAVGRLCVIEDISVPLPVLGVLGQATGARSNTISIFGTGEQIEARRLLLASYVLAIHLPQICDDDR